MKLKVSKLTWEDLGLRSLPPPKFTTHLNYITCLKDLSKDLSLTIGFNPKTKIVESKYLDKKIRLIKLLKKNIDDEFNLIKEDKGFSEMCSTWVSVKVYYLIYL